MKSVASIAALLLAGPVHALSCLPPDPVALYRNAVESEQAYWIVRGRIMPLGPVALPEPGDVGSGTDVSEARTSARLTGLGMQLDGSFRPFAREVVLTLTCLGPWCAGPPDEKQEYFVAVEADRDAPVVRVGPCYGDLVPYSEDGLARLLACVRGEECRAGDF